MQHKACMLPGRGDTSSVPFRHPPGRPYRHLLYLLSVAFLCVAYPLAAQVEGDFLGHPLQVFIQTDINSLGTDRLQFVDSLTGDVLPVDVNGRQYTLVGRAVMFFDVTTNRVMLATSDGTIRPHPFIQPGANTQRIDWVIAGEMIAWTRTDATETGSLTTRTSISDLDGVNAREVLVDGPRDGIRALPVAFDPSMTTLYMDYQPAAVGELAPFQQYAGLFALDLTSGEVQLLPNEPGCYCGAAFGAGLFIRLNLTDDQQGYDVNIYNLAGEVAHDISALRLEGYTQAGDLTLSPDGSRAVYALAQISDFGGVNQSVRTVFVLVNLDSMRQQALTDPITTFMQAVEWTEDSSALIFTSPGRNGTWKINLDDGQLRLVAAASYLGTLR